MFLAVKYANSFKNNMIKYLGLLILIFKMSYAIEKNEFVCKNGNKRTYFSSFSAGKSVPSGIRGALIFLHGLAELSDLDSLKGDFEVLSNLAIKNNLVAFFPLGTKNTFTLKPNLLGWGEGNLENKNYIEELSDFIQAKYGLRNQIFMGFSNGAYFLKDLISKNPAWKFWLQGGGGPKEWGKGLDQRPRIVLEVGQFDNCNIRGVMQMKESLVKGGWILEKDLLFHELASPHKLDLTFFDRNIAFLIKQPQQL